MYGHQIVPSLLYRTVQPPVFFQDIKQSLNFDKVKKQTTIPRNFDNLEVDLYNLTNNKTVKSVVLFGSHYGPVHHPTTYPLLYDPVTVKVEVKKEGIISPNHKVYLFDMNMLLVAQTLSDVEGFAYFYNKPSTYRYHVLAEDCKGEYVSTVVSQLSGKVL